MLARFSDGNPAYVAAHSGDALAFRALLDSSQCLHLISTDLQQAIIWETVSGGHVELLQLLRRDRRTAHWPTWRTIALDSVKSSCGGTYCDTTLVLAAKQGHPSILAFLLESQPLIHELGMSRSSIGAREDPLQVAASCGSLDACRLLFTYYESRGWVTTELLALLTYKSPGGWAEKVHCRQDVPKCRFNVFTFFHSRSVDRIGPDPDITAKALWSALNNAQARIVEFLLDHFADPSHQFCSGCWFHQDGRSNNWSRECPNKPDTCLSRAIKARSLNCVELLLSRRADITARITCRDEYCFACHQCHREQARALDFAKDAHAYDNHAQHILSLLQQEENRLNLVRTEVRHSLVRAAAIGDLTQVKILLQRLFMLFSDRSALQFSDLEITCKSAIENDKHVVLEYLIDLLFDRIEEKQEQRRPASFGQDGCSPIGIYTRGNYHSGCREVGVQLLMHVVSHGTLKGTQILCKALGSHFSKHEVPLSGSETCTWQRVLELAEEAGNSRVGQFVRTRIDIARKGVTMVDDRHLLADIVFWLMLFRERIAVDLEGVELGRHGRISLLQIATSSFGHVFLVDVHLLGSSAFSSHGYTLQHLLEDPCIQKLAFDSRRDSDALFHLYNVEIQHVFDLQVACTLRYSDLNDPYLKGLKFYMEKLKIISEANRDLKDRGRRLFLPEEGGRFDAWEQRPLPPQLIAYAALDVRHLHDMSQTVMRLHQESNERVDGRLFSFAWRPDEDAIKRITSERVKGVVRSSVDPRGPSLSRRDFQLDEGYAAQRQLELQKHHANTIRLQLQAEARRARRARGDYSDDYSYYHTSMRAEYPECYSDFEGYDD